MLLDQPDCLAVLVPRRTEPSLAHVEVSQVLAPFGIPGLETHCHEEELLRLVEAVREEVGSRDVGGERAVAHRPRELVVGLDGLGIVPLQDRKRRQLLVSAVDVGRQLDDVLEGSPSSGVIPLLDQDCTEGIPVLPVAGPKAQGLPEARLRAHQVAGVAVAGRQLHVGLVPVGVYVEDLPELGDRFGVAPRGPEHLGPRQPRLEQPGVELDRSARCVLRLAERLGLVGPAIDSPQRLAQPGVGEGEVLVEGQGLLVERGRHVGAMGIVGGIEVPTRLEIGVVGFR